MNEMKRIFYRAVLVILLVLALLTGTCWFYADHILNRIIRPQIEKTVSQRLDSQVKIGRMNWTDRGIELLTLVVHSSGLFQITIPSVSFDFTFTSLWNRKVNALIVTQPKI